MLMYCNIYSIYYHWPAANLFLFDAQLANNQKLIVCVQTYLEEFKYKNTVYTDLWRHLEMVRYHDSHID